jgi:hypothetical protein
MWHLLLSVNRPNLKILIVEVFYIVYFLDKRRKATMNTENPLVDKGCQAEIIENLSAVSPNVL